MKHSTNSIGSLVRETRKLQSLTQSDLALDCGTGKRFIVDLEKGKSTCGFAKILNALQMLGIEIQLIPPSAQEIDWCFSFFFQFTDSDGNIHIIGILISVQAIEHITRNSKERMSL